MKFEDEMQPIASRAEGRLLAGRIGGVGVMLFNQPEKHNAISVDMWEGMRETLDQFAADDSIRVVIYAGVGGKAFASGADISQFEKHRGNAEANAQYQRLTGRGRQRLAHFEKPSIACLQGYCMGGGMAIALMADIRVAAVDAVLAIPAARLSIAYGADAVERLVQLVGPSRARLILYSARRFSGQDAFGMGLADLVTPADDIAQECLNLARTIAENAPLSVMASRFTVEQVLKPASERDEAALADWTLRCMDSNDYREGRTAFMEKRKPVFTGT